MKVSVYQLVEETNPQVFEVDGQCETPLTSNTSDAVESSLIPPTDKDKRKVRLLSYSDSYSVEVRKINTPGFQTTMRIVEQPDGSVAVRIYGVEIHIVPDTDAKDDQIRTLEDA